MRAIALSMGALPRLELPKVDISKVLDVALFAARTLSYTRPREEIQNMRLLTLLAELNLTPFVPAAVEEYKAAQQKKARTGIWNPMRRKDIIWRLAALRRYEGVVPLSVLQSAQDVYKAAEGVFNTGKVVGFTVDYLADRPMEKEEPVVAYDPFLCVNVEGGPRHRIAVWDEPTFKF